MDLFRYLKYGLSLVLIFIGLKMVVEYAAHHFFGMGADQHVVPPVASLVVVVGLLGISVAASLLAGKAGSHEVSDSDPPQPHQSG